MKQLFSCSFGLLAEFSFSHLENQDLCFLVSCQLGTVPSFQRPYSLAFIPFLQRQKWQILSCFESLLFLIPSLLSDQLGKVLCFSGLMWLDQADFDNPGYFPHFRVLNHNCISKTLFPCKVTFTASGDQDVEVFVESLFTQPQGLKDIN